MTFSVSNHDEVFSMIACFDNTQLDSTMLQVEFVEELIKQAGVVAVPGAGFFHANQSVGVSDGPRSRRYVRFAFCKTNETLAAASAKIKGLVDSRGRLEIFNVGETRVPTHVV